jgi:hypothetical protein
MASVEDAFFLSAKQGRDDDLAELVKQIGPSKINQTDPLGNTALHYSAGAGLYYVDLLWRSSLYFEGIDSVEDVVKNEIVLEILS